MFIELKMNYKTTTVFIQKLDLNHFLL